ncbi:MAG: MFS transporter [Spirochaetales bacterium]|jgi:hypothetical protein|nr:MFS transporter [Spirochaetales bacterium]
MADRGLTTLQKERGRRLYLNFQLFNVISFTMLSGSVLTLFALKLGAGSLFIGVISSLVNLGFILIIVGRQFVTRIGARRQWGYSWLLRNLTMIPILFAPALAASGRQIGALLLIFLPFFFFNFFKGTGLVGVNPIVGALSEGKDRGSFLARSQINIHIVLIITNLIIAFALGPNAEISRYLTLISTGIVAGIVSTFFLFKIPERSGNGRGTESSLIAGIKKGLGRPDFRYFITLIGLVALITGMANPFLVLFAKKIYNLSDQAVVFFLVIGSTGAITMGLITRKLIDRLGAKPLYLMFLCVLCLSIILLLAAPNLGEVSKLVYLGFLFFLYNFGFVGGASSAQNYFFNITHTDEHMNLGLLNNVAAGAAGTIGALAGGAVLVAFESLFTMPENAFRALYSIALVLLILCFPLVFKLKNIGNFSVRDAFEVLISRRNLRAVALLHKLDTTKTVREEIEIIDSLGNSASPMVHGDLLEKMKSPRFYIRSRALRALENLPLNDSIINALIGEVKNHAFTTGHVAARIIGRKGIQKGIRVLRTSLSSEDYLLQSESALALARLTDRRSIPKIERVLALSANPLVKTYAAASLEILKNLSSISCLLEVLKQQPSPPFLRDELILSIAGILDIGDWFYSFYSQFLEQARVGVSDLIDYMKDRGTSAKRTGAFAELMTTMMTDRRSFGTCVADLIENRYRKEYDFAVFFVAAGRDEELLRFDRLAFLIAAVFARLECGWPA